MFLPPIAADLEAEPLPWPPRGTTWAVVTQCWTQAATSPVKPPDARGKLQPCPVHNGISTPTAVARAQGQQGWGVWAHPLGHLHGDQVQWWALPPSTGDGVPWKHFQHHCGVARERGQQEQTGGSPAHLCPQPSPGPKERIHDQHWCPTVGKRTPEPAEWMAVNVHQSKAKRPSGDSSGPVAAQLGFRGCRPRWTSSWVQQIERQQEQDAGGWRCRSSKPSRPLLHSTPGLMWWPWSSSAAATWTARHCRLLHRAGPIASVCVCLEEATEPTGGWAQQLWCSDSALLGHGDGAWC